MPESAPEARAQMLIRRPAAEVFEAFVDPAITARFWFSKGSDRLEPGKRVRWEWEMYGVGSDVEVKAVTPDERILVEWDGPDTPTSVEWRFEPKGADSTFVAVRNWGFHGDGGSVVAQALDSTGGFNLLLAGAKIFLEHGIEPHFVADHAPDAIVATPPASDPHRPFGHSVERDMAASPAALYRAWTEDWERWFAAPGSFAGRAEVGAPFCFAVEHAGRRYPHYGRFLRLDPDRLVELTWVTGKGGTEGAETVVTVELEPRGAGTRLTLTQRGFYREDSRRENEQAWPHVLAHLDEALATAR